jgi:hypothetical protein
MILKLRIPRVSSSASRGGMMALGATPAVAGATFHATLTDCMDDWVVEHMPRASTGMAARPTRRKVQPKAKTQAQTPGAITRAWSWLQTKCAQTTTKRLRVSETVSLGEKRFVALVNVEGREFLIGGGSAGVSMLTALETSRAAGDAMRDDLDDAEGCE